MIEFVEDFLVKERLYKQFEYLQDLPFEIYGSCIEDAMNFGILESDDFLGCLMAYEVEKQSPSRDRFAFFTARENLQLDRYLHIRPAEPWPQPIVGVSFSTDGVGKTTGTHKVSVLLKNIGEVQLHWGTNSKLAAIWEAYLREEYKNFMGLNFL